MKKEHVFDELFKSHYQKVFRLCKGYFNGNVDLAADSAQEIFIKIWQNLHNFRGEAQIGTWIYRIAVNHCLTLLRKNKRNQKIHFDFLINSLQEEKTDDKEEKIATMYSCIQKLKPVDRMIILMTLEAVSYADIAEVIGIEEGNLRVRIHRIKNRLTKCVQL